MWRPSFLFALLLPGIVAAQAYDPLHPPNTFRHADNPYYWQNSTPRPGYWQQDVHYNMAAKLDEENDLIQGSAVLTYWNNSPDTLREVFFHLYANAARKDSYRSTLLGPGHWLRGDHQGTEVTTMTADGQELVREVDNTVMRVTLARPLLPGGSMEFRYAFNTRYGGMSRMKTYKQWGFKHFNGTQWYPRISVYDRKFGWDTQQHLGHEYYGDFGTFDVSLDMPNDMVVEATGWLQNPEEVMPPELRRKLDIANFKDKPMGEAPSVITPYQPGVRKVWRYHAENVHDFAFTADPTYRIGEAEWNGIKCIAVACEPHAAKWQNAAEYAALCIKTLSNLVGPYGYPKMVVADARDGMEYPMLTLDSGEEPDYRTLFMHEIGHNWFFGMVGNNETYRAMLDEGFTQFIETMGMEIADGDTLVEEAPANAYARRWTNPQLARDRLAYNSYMHAAVRNALPPVNVHSDEYARLPTGYRMVYYKTATMLFNLQYTLGDSLFLGALRHYFNQWKFKHPYMEDMRQSFTDYTKTDLNWFFDQWIESGKVLDYGVKGVKNRKADSGQVIHFRRVGDMQMPIDFTVTANNGKTYPFHIPNNWFVKQTQATVLPRWIGFDDLARDYHARVDIPTGIANVQIDTTFRLGDANPLNNSLRFPLTSTFDSHIRNAPDRRSYESFVRPDLWYNGFDGIKAGVHFNGSFFRYKHQVWFTAWLNTGLAQNLPGGQVLTDYQPINFNFRYENGTGRLLNGSSVHVAARLLDGLEQYEGGFKWDIPFTNTSLYTNAKFMLRRDSADLTYLLYPGLWQLNALNSTWNTGVEHRYNWSKGNGSVALDVRTAGVGAAFPFAQAAATAINSTRLGRLDLRTRAMAQYGSGNTPRESQLYLAGASPEDLMDNKYVRSIGFVPFDWMGYGAGLNHFHQSGGLGLRGYAGYLAPEDIGGGNTILTYAGNTGAAINAELDLDGLVRFRPGKLADYLHLDVYLFGDVGTMGYRTVTDLGTPQVKLALPRADAGAGAALTIKKFGPLDHIKPLTIRFDMPLVLSAIPAGESEHVAFRYVVGIGRSF
ncbi:MAG TPA: M1 family metallopeptidase [Flavobacteriales bacterium]|nr:M1 family metallopeptidase [Flavobacteriales bacterium]